MIARFESREAAERNSARPEQTAWWDETARCFDGPVTFHDTEDVHLMMHGNLDEAHFVQAMDGHVTDHDRAVAIEQDADSMLAELRPELLGAMTAFYDEDSFTEVAYFTSEADARRAEHQDMPTAGRDDDGRMAATDEDRPLPRHHRTLAHHRLSAPVLHKPGDPRPHPSTRVPAAHHHGVPCDR